VVKKRTLPNSQIGKSPRTAPVEKNTGPTNVEKLQTGPHTPTVAKGEITPSGVLSEPLHNWQETEVSVVRGGFQTSWRTEPASQSCDHVRAWGSQPEWAGQIPGGQHQIHRQVPSIDKDMK